MFGLLGGYQAQTQDLILYHEHFANSSAPHMEVLKLEFQGKNGMDSDPCPAFDLFTFDKNINPPDDTWYTVYDYCKIKIRHSGTHL